MPTRAFVLCSDEKALDAVSQILGELEIAFEQFHDIEFATKRLAVQAFDLVLVDCDHQDDAARLLERMRSSDLNRGAMMLAVVDGRAGVPTAFRLGAELVIAKPVSLEQARNTLRTALAMRKKTHPEATALPRPLGVTTKPLADAKAPNQPVAFVAPVAELPHPKSQPGAVMPKASPEPKLKKVPPVNSGLSLSMPHASKEDEEVSPSSLELTPEQATRLAPEKPGYPLPAEAFRHKVVRRAVNSSLVAALVLAIVGAAGYEAYNTVPAFRTTVDANYQLLRSQIPGMKPAVAVAPKLPPPVRVAVKPDPTPTVPADGFISTSDAIPGTDASKLSAAKTSKPVILATTATTTTVEEPAPITVPDDLADQHVSTRVDPIYPDKLRRKGVHGDVVLQAVVTKDGTVDSVSVVSGNPQLAAAAMDAVKQWKYQTYLHNGAPANFQTNVTVSFEAPEKAAH